MTPRRTLALTAVLALGGIGVGAAVANATNPGASATPAAVVSQDDSTATTVASDAEQDTDADDGDDRGGRGDETPLVGDEAAKVEAAVLAAYPDATIERMEADGDGDAFEAHVTLADGSRATVKLDASFNVTATETGGRGGHGGRGGRGGPHSANGITEEELSGDDAAKVEAAVAAAQPGATIERMETDADGDAFEAHVTLADGSRATVKLDASFNVTATETGGPGHG